MPVRNIGYTIIVDRAPLSESPVSGPCSNEQSALVCIPQTWPTTKSCAENVSLLEIYPTRHVARGILYKHIRQMNPIMAMTGVS
jgi:hypothetical protein